MLVCEVLLDIFNLFLMNSVTACSDDADFDKTCVEIFNGTRDGGRCFFLGNITGNWTAAFSVCEQYGTVLAQVHTTSEFSKIEQYLSVCFFHAQY